MEKSLIGHDRFSLTLKLTRRLNLNGYHAAFLVFNEFISVEQLSLIVKGQCRRLTAMPILIHIDMAPGPFPF